MAHVFDPDVFHFALETMSLVHRTNALVREPMWVLLAALAARLLLSREHSGVYY